MDLFVQYYETCVDSYRDGKEYGEWRESYDFNVTGVSLTSQKRMDEEQLGCLVDVKAGDTVYVLSMTYSTGDSFGHAEGRGEVIWVFVDPALAWIAKSIWEKENDKRNPEFSIEFAVDGDQTVKQSNPAAGYFENIGRVDVTSFVVEP